MRVLRTVNLKENLPYPRDVEENIWISCIDVDQTNGNILTTHPFDQNGSGYGDLTIYSQAINYYNTRKIDYVGNAGYLLNPMAAKFDWIRRKIWVLDTGNNRVLKLNVDTGNAEINVDNQIDLPYALAINPNNGGCFVGGYSNNSKKIISIQSNGKQDFSFIYGSTEDTETSSSSFSSSSSSESNSNAEIDFSQFPLYNTISYDHVRNKLWWIDNSKCYLADINNKQVKTLLLTIYGINETKSIDVNYDDGYPYILCVDYRNHNIIAKLTKSNSGLVTFGFIKDP